MIELWQHVLCRLREGETVFLAWVADNGRHSPGTVGAGLALTANGEPVGTIGGGIMEHRVIERARTLLSQEPDRAFAELQTLHHQKRAAGELSGMICAGWQTNLYFLCRPAVDLEAVAGFVEALAEDASVRLVFDPRGLRLETTTIDLNAPRYQLSADGDEWCFRMDAIERRRLALLGGGHCAQAVARVMHSLGYRVDLWENRPDVIPPHFEDIAGVHHVDQFEHAGSQVSAPESTVVIVMTTAMPEDVAALAGALPQSFPFVGVMGSRAKLNEIHRRLRQRGFSTQALERIVAPVGLPIASHTPAEIAISVAAQLIAWRNGAADAVSVG